MIRLLLGGSPCTYWSIAQTKNRETEASGQGWELFKNYLLALRRYRPHYFLYENNKSMAPAIRAQITRELKVEPILINSALVSAQNRQRLYWTNIPGVEQPEDRGILLRDILENGLPLREKGYALLGTTGGSTAEDMIARCQRNGAAEPVRIGTIESEVKNAGFDSQQYRVYSPEGKSVTLCGQGGGVGAKTGLYAIPQTMGPVRVCNINGGGQGNRIYRTDAKSCAVTAQGCGLGGNGQGLYAILIEPSTGKEWPVYEVRDGQITIKGKQHPVKLTDGFYIIRKLTVTECKRLQTVPDSYVFPVSNTQAYKMLGNGWTVDVIAHILHYVPGITEEPLEVLSMYDGMSCGHLALDKLGAHIRRYVATEVDKYAIQTAKYNFPDIEHIGNAFGVRTERWWQFYDL